MGQQRAVHGLTGDEVHILAHQEVEAVAVGGIEGHLHLVFGGAEAHHGLEEVALTLLDVLTHGVEVSGELHAGGEETLVLLALALAVELLPPLGHEAEAGLVSGQHLDLIAGAVQGRAACGILPCGVGGVVGLGAGLHHLGSAAHEGIDVHACYGDGQQTHGGQHTVAAAHVIGDNEGFVAVLVGQILQRTLVGIGGGIDALGSALLAVLLLCQLAEEAEGHGGLSGSAGLGDDVDGEVHALQQLLHLVHGVGAETVTHKVDVGGGLLLQIVVGGAEALDNTAGAQIGAADADDHQRLRIALNLGGSGLDAGIFFLVIVAGEIHPADEVVACACAVLQMALRGVQLGQQGFGVVGSNKGFDVGVIDADHSKCLLCVIFQYGCIKIF